MSRRVSNDLQGWRCHNLSGQPVKVFSNPQRKKLFLTFNCNCLYFNLCPLPLFLSWGTTVKNLAQSSLILPFRYLYTWRQSSWAFPFPAEHSQPALSACPHTAYAPSPLSSLWPLAGLTLEWPWHSRPREPRTWPSTPDVPLHSWSEGKHHVPWPAGTTLPNTAQEPVGLCCKDTLLARVHLESTRTPTAFSTKLVSSWSALIYTGGWGYYSPGAQLCTSLCWTSWGSRQTICPACWGPFGQQQNPLMYHPLLPVL